TAQEMQKRGITSLDALQYDVPGLFVQQGQTQRRITIRGVSNLFGNGALVGQYVNDADVTPEGQTGSGGFGQFDVQTYDLSRVEVLRGPQGTLYGDGSMGGVIRFITNKPALDGF